MYKKSTRTVAKFKGPLKIGDNLSLGIRVYKKTGEDKLPTLKKYSLATEFD